MRRGKLVARPRLAKSNALGAEHLPSCPRCDNTLVWRGGWCCDACPARISWTEYEGGREAPRVALPPELPASVLAAAPLFSSSEGHNCAKSGGDSENGRKGWLAWIEQVEMHTSLWRQKKGARHQGKSASHWHRQRRQGQAERFDRVVACGTVKWVLSRHSPQGTTERPLATRCDCWRVCSRCLDRRRFKLRTGIEQQRERALKLHSRQVARWYTGSEGRWSERLITLTVPHGESPAHDARLLTKGWRELSRRIAQHLKLDREAEAKPVWVRAMEVAPTETGGHAHLHVWWFGPFIDHAWLRATWGHVLERFGAKVPRIVWSEAVAKSVDKRFAQWARSCRGKHGRATATVPWPIVDVRSAYSGGASEYATKVGVALYISKGAKGQPERIHPLHAATIYQALESARAVQWARGWAPKVEPEPGVTWSRRRLSDEEIAEQHAKHAAADRVWCVAFDASQAAALAALQVVHEEPPDEAQPEKRAAEQLALGV